MSRRLDGILSRHSSGPKPVINEEFSLIVGRSHKTRAMGSNCIHKESVTERESVSSSDKYAAVLVLLAV